MSEILKSVTDENFAKEVLQAEGPVLVDFWAEWCTPCRMMQPALESVAGKFSGRARVVKLNVDDNPSTAQRYGIKGIPTMILFRGGHEAERLVGATSESSVVRLIETQLNVAA